MKQTARKLLSLVMALAIVLSLAPTALAAGEYTVEITGDTNAKLGETVTLSASVTKDETDVTDATYSWKVSEELSIDGASNASSVKVTAKNPSATATVTGTVTCEVTGANGESGEDSQNVTFEYEAPAQPTVTGVDLDTEKLEFEVGGKTQGTVTATVKGDNLTDADKGVTWKLEPANSPYVEYTVDGTTATVKLKSSVTTAPEWEQSATLTATSVKDGTKSRSCTITVKKAAAPTTPTQILFDSTNVTKLKVGATTTWTCSFKPNGTVGEVTWDSSKKNVATVDATGKITALAPGETEIKVALKSDPTVEKTAVLTVEPATQTVEAELTPTTKTPSVGAKDGLTLKVSGANAAQAVKVKWSADPAANVTFTSTESAISSNSAAGEVTIKKAGKVTITAEVLNQAGQTIGTATTDLTVAEPLTISPSSKKLTYTNETATLTASFNGTEIKNDSNLKWYIGTVGSTASKNSYVSLTSNANGTATVTALANTTSATKIIATYVSGGVTFEATCLVTVAFAADITPSVTVYDTNTGYALTDTPDYGSTGSVADQIASQVRTRFGSYNYYTVQFDTVGNSSNKNGYLDASKSYAYDEDDLEDAVFSPTVSLTSSNPTAEASYNITVRVYAKGDDYDHPSKTYDGVITFKIRQGESSSGDISYVAALGEDVYFNVADFEDFWNGKGKNTLDYVTFSSASGGTLYNSSGKNTSSTKCYVDPSSRQTALDGVYFSPNSTTSKKATTVRVSFTAYGASSGSKTGTVVITYLNKSASDITYSTGSNGTVSLDASDFTAAYKEATGKTAPSNMTIVFQGVPTYGSLTYLDSSKTNAKEVKLTNSNIKSRSFNAKTSKTTNKLEDVTYTGSGSRTDTIEYIAYSGSTAQFSGKVVFNTVTAPTDVRVNFVCSSTTGVAFNSSSFTAANSALSSATNIQFTAPRLGTLRYNYGTGTGVSIPMSSLNAVTYVPTGSNGTDSITFVAYNAQNKVVASGSVSVVVSLPATNPGAITSISQFRDIPAGAASSWYTSQLTSLISRGVISGTGDGKFEPDAALDYGAALKMIMNAGGYVQAERPDLGDDWAINYKTYAATNGWISSSVKLTDKITRNAMAELAAKVLGVSASSQANPFKDAANAYAIALYYTTPRVLQGDVRDGGRYFDPNNNLTRSEMVCLVYNMYAYSGK